MYTTKTNTENDSINNFVWNNKSERYQSEDLQEHNKNYDDTWSESQLRNGQNKNTSSSVINWYSKQNCKVKSSG